MSDGDLRTAAQQLRGLTSDATPTTADGINGKSRTALPEALTVGR